MPDDTNDDSQAAPQPEGTKPQPPPTETLEDAVNAQIPPGVLPTILRERASELQLFWSWVAVGMLVAIIGLTIWNLWDWHVTQEELLLHIKPDPEGVISDAAIRSYTELSKNTFANMWRIMDGVILGGLLSIFTLIVGYVFGSNQRKTLRRDKT